VIYVFACVRTVTLRDAKKIAELQPAKGRISGIWQSNRLRLASSASQSNFMRAMRSWQSAATPQRWLNALWAAPTRVLVSAVKLDRRAFANCVSNSPRLRKLAPDWGDRMTVTRCSPANEATHG